MNPILSMFPAPPTCLKHTVGGSQVEIHPLRMTTLFRARSILKPLAKAWVGLTQDSAKESGFEQTHRKRGEEIEQTTKSLPSTPEQTKARAEARATNIEVLIESLLGAGSQPILSLLISDSLRQPEMTPKEAEQFFSETPVSVVVELLTGILLVQKDMFAPLVNRVPAALAAALKPEAAESQEPPAAQ